MTREERLQLLKQIEKDIHVCSIESTFLDDAKSCAIHSVIEELEQEPKWIPVSERLPKNRGFYLVSTTDCITIMEFISGWISQNIGLCNGYVKAWMPLPQPYKAESEDKE